MDYIEFSKYFRYISKCLALDHFVIEGKPFQRNIRISFKKSIFLIGVYIIIMICHSIVLIGLPTLERKNETVLQMDLLVQVIQIEHLNEVNLNEIVFSMVDLILRLFSIIMFTSDIHLNACVAEQQ